MIGVLAINNFWTVFSSLCLLLALNPSFKLSSYSWDLSLIFRRNSTWSALDWCLMNYFAALSLAWLPLVKSFSRIWQCLLLPACSVPWPSFSSLASSSRRSLQDSIFSLSSFSFLPYIYSFNRSSKLCLATASIGWWSIEPTRSNIPSACWLVSLRKTSDLPMNPFWSNLKIISSIAALDGAQTTIFLF